ncbi:MAG: phosphoribosylamine---glycine ligase [Clostridia bacterium]|nr:phosphoribosylamine---glycine ligase [Clostridia bacterium]
MRILIVGSGGREHALVWKISQSPKVKEIYCAPGNAGIAKLATCVPIEPDNINELVNFARHTGIDLTVVGPEAPLVAGIVDAFKEANLPVFGPSKAAARLEGSKIFAKDLMRKAGVPTADYATFDDEESALAYLGKYPGPMVIKADGLAAGKGVVVASNLDEAKDAVKTMFAGKFGNAGHKVVIEEFLKGQEVSILAFCDGKTVLPLLPSQDHKRVGEGDTGPNTGGMGAYAPVPFYTSEVSKQVVEKILEPTIKAMAEAGYPYQGVLYAGLMLTSDGPKVLEFNCRFGDPETQPLMMLLKSDLVDIMEATINGQLAEIELEWYPGSAAGVVLASAGYPGSYTKGEPISGLDSLPSGVEAFHAGTSLKKGQMVTAGGRVLCITARGENLKAALEKAYAGVETVDFKGKQYRTDIGHKAL